MYHIKKRLTSQIEVKKSRFICILIPLDNDREIKEISTMLLNRKVNIPGVLIEVGFLSNANERYLLRQESYQDKIATNISEVLVEYYN